MNDSIYKRAVRRVAPVRIRRGGVQNTSRQRALLDPRNALSCTATWNAVADGADDGRKIHKWDELSVELNGFGKKVKLLMTAKCAKTLRKRNLTPATTRNQGKRRTLKIGISKFNYNLNSTVVVPGPRSRSYRIVLRYTTHRTLQSVVSS